MFAGVTIAATEPKRHYVDDFRGSSAYNGVSHSDADLATRLYGEF